MTVAEGVTDKLCQEFLANVISKRQYPDSSYRMHFVRQRDFMRRLIKFHRSRRLTALLRKGMKHWIAYYRQHSLKEYALLTGRPVGVTYYKETNFYLPTYPDDADDNRKQNRS